MRPRPPQIPKPSPHGANLGLVDRLTAIPRGAYADVIVQFVSSTLSDRNGMPCLLVWDGSDWPHDSRPLFSMDSEERLPAIQPDPAVIEKARGRIVTIFSYDYDNQLKHPIKSGDWLYIQNVHCGYTKESRYSSFMMHNNAHPRFIWRLDLPMADGLFYEKQWKEAIARVTNAQPVAPDVILRLQQQQQQQQVAAAATPGTPGWAAMDRLQKLIIDGMLREGIRAPSTDAEFEAVARAALAAMKAAGAAADAAEAAVPPQLTPPEAAPSTAGPAAAAAAVSPAVQQAADAVRPSSSTAAAAAAGSPRSPRSAPAAASPPATTRAAAAAAATAASPSTKRRSKPIKREEPMEEERRSPRKAANPNGGEEEEEEREERPASRGRKRRSDVSLKAEAASPKTKQVLRSTVGRSPPPTKRSSARELLIARMMEK